MENTIYEQKLIDYKETTEWHDLVIELLKRIELNTRK